MARARGRRTDALVSIDDRHDVPAPRAIARAMQRARIGAVVVLALAGLRGDIAPNPIHTWIAVGAFALAMVVASAAGSFPWWRTTAHTRAMAAIVLDAGAVGGTLWFCEETAFLFILLALPQIEAAIHFRTLGATVVGFAGGLLLALHWLFEGSSVAVDGALDLAVAITALAFVSVPVSRLAESLASRIARADLDHRMADVRAALLTELIESTRSLATGSELRLRVAVLDALERLGARSSSLHEVTRAGTVRSLGAQTVSADCRVPATAWDELRTVLDARGGVVMLQTAGRMRDRSGLALVACAVRVRDSAWIVRSMVPTELSAHFAHALDILAAQVILSARHVEPAAHSSTGEHAPDELALRRAMRAVNG